MIIKKTNFSIQKFILLLFNISYLFFLYMNNALYKICLVSIIGYLSLWIIGKKKKIVVYNYIVCMILFDLWAYMSTFWARVLHYDVIIVLLFDTVIVALLLQYINNKTTLFVFMQMFLLGANILTVYVGMYYGISSMLKNRISNDVINSNELSIICSVAVIISLYIYSGTKKKIYLLSILWFMSMCLLCGSKTGILDCVVGGFVFLFVVGKHSYKQLFRNTLIALFAVFVLYFLLMQVDPLYNLLGQRIENMINIVRIGSYNNAYESTNMRYIMINSAIDCFKDNPINGIGVDCFKDISIFRTYSHSNFFELLADLGLVGTMLFYGPIYGIIHSLIKKKRLIYENDKAYIMAIVSILCVNSFTTVFYQEILEYLLIMTCFILIKNSKKDG